MAVQYWFEDGAGDMFRVHSRTGDLQVRWFDEHSRMTDLIKKDDIDAFIAWLIEQRSNWIKENQNDQV